VSPDGTLLAYSTDSTGYRQYVLAVKDLSSGKTLTDHAERVTSVAWAADGKTLFYTQEDSIAKRSYRLYRHTLGASDDQLVYEEKDERFEIGVDMTRSREWLIQTRSSHTTSEVAVLPANAPAARMEVLVQRLVLGVVPADSDAQAQAPAREHIDGGGLLGHQRGLTLREDDDAGHQLEPLRARPEIAKEHEWLVERALVGVGRTAPQLVEALQCGAEHVVEHEQVIVAGSFGRLRVVADHRGVRADLRLGKHHAESHGRALSSSRAGFGKGTISSLRDYHGRRIMRRGQRSVVAEWRNRCE